MPHDSEHQTDDTRHLAKPLNHNDEPAEMPSEDIVRRRARELAVIEGRDPTQLRDRDISRAREELRDLASRDGSPLPIAEAYDARDTSDPAGGVAGRVPRQQALDENEERADLAREGVEEAEHDQMINARREGGNQEQ